MIAAVVFALAVLRAAALGYGGPAFAEPVLVGALLPAAALAVPAALVALARLQGETVRRVRFALETVVLALLFTPGWVAMHTGLATALLAPGAGAAFSLATGVAVAGLLDTVAYRFGRAYASALQVGLAAAFVLGVDVVASFDEIAAGSRWSRARSAGACLRARAPAAAG